MFMSNDVRSGDYMDLRTKRGWRLLGKLIWKYKWIYVLMLFPGLSLMVLFRYFPLPGILLAFKSFRPVFGGVGGLFGFLEASPWVGIAHFQRMMIEPSFWVAVRNTIIISLYRLVVGFPYPIILALMISEIMFKKTKRTLQTIYTFPHFLSWVVVSGIILNLLGDSGAIKKIFMAFDPSYRDTWNVLFNRDMFRGLVVFSGIWKSGGWGTILYLAAITSIDPSLAEAATIDGCNRFRRIWHITLPGISGIVIIMLILTIGGMMDANFDQIFNLYSAPVFRVGDIIDTYIYRMTFQSTTRMDFGFTTAAGLFRNVINFALLVGANQTAKKMSGVGIM